MGHVYIQSLWSLPFVTAQCIKLQFLTLLKISCSLSVLARLRYPALCNKCQQRQTTNVKLPLWIINKPPCDKQAHQNKMIFHHENWHGCARKPTVVPALYQYGINARYGQVWGFWSSVVMGNKAVSIDIRYLAFRNRAPNYYLTTKTGSLCSGSGLHKHTKKRRIIQPPFPLYMHDSSWMECDKPHLGLWLHIVMINGYNDTKAGPRNFCVQNRNRIIQMVFLTSLTVHPAPPALPRQGRMAYGGSTTKGLRSFWCATVPFVKPHELCSTPKHHSTAAAVVYDPPKWYANTLPPAPQCRSQRFAQLVGNSPPLTNMFTVGPCVNEFSSQPAKLYWVGDRE